MEKTLRVAVALWPGLDQQVLEPATRARLAEAVEVLQPLPVDLATQPDEVLADVDVLLAGWGCPALDGPLLDRLPGLKLLAYAAGSVKATVTDELWRRDVAVSSAAAANAVPVAELTFAAVVMIAKDVFRIRDSFRASRGALPVEGHGPAGPVGTRGLKVGVVGASRIGRLVVERLRTLDCSIAVSDPFLTADDAAAMGAHLVELDELCRWADVVTLHAPAVPATHHMIDSGRLALMHDGAWVVNTARGSLVDTAALESECASGRLCAFIDTPDPEPLPEQSLLWDLPNVVLTPHIAGSLGTEIARMGELAVDEVLRFAAGAPLHHRVRHSDLEHIA